MCGESDVGRQIGELSGRRNIKQFETTKKRSVRKENRREKGILYTVGRGCYHTYILCEHVCDIE